MIKENSATHDLLQVAKVLARPFGAKEAMSVMVSLDRPSRVRDCANILAKHNLLEIMGSDKYLITEYGRKYLYSMVSLKNITQ